MPIRTTPKSTQAPVNVVGSSVFGRYAKISSEKTYNMFISDNWLVNFSGYKKVLQILPTGAGRGLFRSVRGGFMLAVVNSEVVRIDEDLGISIIGALNSSFGDVYIDENLNNQICLVDGVNIYLYSYLTAQFTVQDAVSGLIPSYVCYHNTRFLIGNGNRNTAGSTWYAYSFGDEIALGTAQIFALHTKPDYATAIKRIPGQGNNVLVLGTTVCEIFTQVAGLDAYQRNSTINVDYGCLSVSTIASSDTFIAWLGVNENNAPVIMVYTDQGAQPISTDGIDYVLQQINFPAKSTAMFFRQDGHLFYQITFYDLSDNLTLVYDFTTKKFFNLTDADLNYHPATEVVYFNQKTYFISLNDASLYEFSTNYTTYDGLEIPRVRVCKSIRAQNSQRFIANSLVVIIEQGCDPDFVALNLDTVNYIVRENIQDRMLAEDGVTFIVAEGSGPAESPSSMASSPLIYRPRVDLSLSYDGGITFGNWVARELNPLGYRKNMLTWEKMGAANDLTMKFRFIGTARFIANDGICDIY
jgi:hypothetical protein